MRVLQVLKPGFFTTIQDLGRQGSLRFGVPISGAMDTFSLTAANLLVGNASNQACLETTMIGPELQALTRTQIAVAGGNTSMKINGKNARIWETLDLQEGDCISLGRMESGSRAYVAVRGGIDVPMVLGSRSTYVRGGVGGADGRKLKAGDVIRGFDAQPIIGRFELPEELVPEFSRSLKVGVVVGPQEDAFTENGIGTFLSSQYTITPESDRMGYRLEGPLIEHKGKTDIISDALLPGAVQVPKSGNPIVIMRDAQTTGGYPKIAVVTSPDLNVLGQARPGDTVEFSKMTIEGAHEKTQEYYGQLTKLKESLRKKG
jgi:antagonist of KipI